MKKYIKKMFIRSIIALSLLILSFPGVVSAQNDMEVFFSTESGTPYKSDALESDLVFWNYSFGAEQYIAKKLSIGLSYRKTFYLLGKSLAVTEHSTEYGGYRYHYKVDYNLYAIDFESKYFFDAPDDDGGYFSSGVSYWHINETTDITQIDKPQGNTIFKQMLPEGEKSNVYSLFPITFKWGYRTAGDVLVFDYYLGVSFHLGSGGVPRSYENNDFYYAPLKGYSIIFGAKLGFKI